MTTRRIALLTTVLMLTLAGAAQAAVLVTPLFMALGTNDADCTIVNVGNQPRTVTIDVVSSLGTVQESFTGLVNPGTIGLEFESNPGGSRYCRFTVEGGKQTWRAAGCVFQDNVGYIMCVPAQ